MRSILAYAAIGAAVTPVVLAGAEDIATFLPASVTRRRIRGKDTARDIRPGCKPHAEVGNCLAVGCFMNHGNAHCKGTSCICDPGFCSSNGWYCESIGMPGPDITKDDKCTGEDISGVYHDLHDANNKLIEVDKDFRVTISPPHIGSKYYVDGIGKNWIVKHDNVGPIDDSCVVHDVDFNVRNKPAPPPGNVTAVFAYSPLLNISWIESCGEDTVGNAKCGKTGIYPSRASPDPVVVFAFGTLNNAGNVWVKIADLPKLTPARHEHRNHSHHRGENGTCKVDAVVGSCFMVGCYLHSNAHCSTTSCICDPGYCSADGSTCVAIGMPTPTITKADDCESKQISGVYHDLHDANNKIIRVDKNYHVTITPPKHGSPYYVEGIGKNWIVKPENVGNIDDDCVVNNLDFNVKNKPFPPPGNVTAVFVETPLNSISFVRSCGPATVGSAKCGQTGAFPNITNPQPVVAFAFGMLSDAGNVWVKIADIPADDHGNNQHRNQHGNPHWQQHPKAAVDMNELRIASAGNPVVVLASVSAVLGVLVAAARRQRSARIEQPPLLA